MKGLGVCYDCAKAEIVARFGPTAMGPSPSEAQGLVLDIYAVGDRGGGKKYPKNDKFDKILIKMTLKWFGGPNYAQKI